MLALDCVALWRRLSLAELNLTLKHYLTEKVLLPGLTANDGQSVTICSCSAGWHTHFFFFF